jgi:site-specific DNA recombinase
VKAAIYCRVSTDAQEHEGTSLQTQLESCRNYCQNKGYEVAYHFSEAYSGLTLERPKLSELRELVRAGDIDVVVVYCLDRLSRDPTHGVIITQELEKHNVTLEAVTETVDSSELGKLISYIRSFASKLEAEKIKERTGRGRRAKAKLGYIPGGGFAKTYGYDYITKRDGDSGRRVINETEAAYVKQIYQWLVNDELSTTGIANRLNSLGVPSKRGSYWSKQTVGAILRNQSYTGKTLAFTTLRNRGKYKRPKEEWVEIPAVTPAIINQELFDAAQRQLQINRAKTVNTTKHDYLLRGHIRCRQCGRAYTGGIHSKVVKGKRYVKRRYRCMGKVRLYSPFNRCNNQNWMADKLEAMVWAELERYLSDRDLILSQLESQRHAAGQLSVFEAELERIDRQLKVVDREQHQLLQWALKGFPEYQVVSENKRLNKAKETLKAQKSELEAQLKVSQDAVINVPNLGRFIKDIQDKLPNLDFEGKRLALDMLGITVWLDGENVEVTGTIDPEVSVTQTTQTGQ